VSINLRNSFFLLMNHRSIQWGSEVPPLFIKVLFPRFPSGLAGFRVETTRPLSVAMQLVQSSVLSVPASRGFYSQPTAAWHDSVRFLDWLSSLPTPSSATIVVISMTGLTVRTTPKLHLTTE